ETGPKRIRIVMRGSRAEGARGFFVMGDCNALHPVVDSFFPLLCKFFRRLNFRARVENAGKTLDFCHGVFAHTNPKRQRGLFRPAGDWSSWVGEVTKSTQLLKMGKNRFG